MHPKYVIRRENEIKGTNKNDDKKRNDAENGEEEEKQEGLPLHGRFFVSSPLPFIIPVISISFSYEA